MKDIARLREVVQFIRNAELNFKQYLVLLHQEVIVTNFIHSVITVGYGDRSISYDNAKSLLKKFNYESDNILLK